METWNEEFAMHRGKEDSFEGWYVRVHDTSCSFAVIFGISHTKDDPHAFIQTLDTITKQTQYVRYTLKQVRICPYPFQLCIADSTLDASGMRLALMNCPIEMVGCMKFSQLQKLPRSIYSPTIMGPLSYRKELECVHTICSMHHHVSGDLQIQNRRFSLHGDGYMEKDRGTSFPKHYIWLQSNVCQEEQASFFLALANVPIRSISFQGIISCLQLSNKLYRFASYYGAITKVVKRSEHAYMIIVYQGWDRLYIKVRQGKRYELKAPKNGRMGPKVFEGLEGEITIRLYHCHTCIHTLHFHQCANEFFLS